MTIENPIRPYATMDETTQARVREVKRLLESSDWFDPCDFQSNVADMLANLRHYCDAAGIYFDEADRIAANNYDSERAGL